MEQIVSFPQRITDDWFARSAASQIAAIDQPQTTSIVLDFSSTTWANPIPLLYFACYIAKVQRRRIRTASPFSVTTDLGYTRKSRDNRFIRFFVQEGFIDLFHSLGHVIWRPRSKDRRSTDLSHIKQSILSLPVLPAYENSTMVKACLIDLFSTTSQMRREIVENLVETAHSVGITRWIPNSGPERGLLSQRIRVLLAETLENVFEHAYPSEQSAYAALYCRIRQGRPSDPDHRTEWISLVNQERRKDGVCLEKISFDREPGWLEIFLVDTGIGLVSSLRRSGSDPLSDLRSDLFTKRIRKPSRSRIEKPSKTGFMHLGKVIRHHAAVSGRGDYIRINSSNEWLGEHFPWPTAATGGYQNFAKRNLHSLPGLSLHFSLEPFLTTSTGVSISTYFPTHVTRNSDLSYILHHTPPISQFSPDFVDFTLNEINGSLVSDSITPGDNQQASWIQLLKSDTICFRIARTMRKNEIINIITQLVTQSKPGGPGRHIIFVDNPLHIAVDLSLIFDELEIKRNVVLGTTISIITNNWEVVTFRWNPSTSSFDRIKTQDTSISENLAYIYRRLKNTDTKQFWRAASDVLLTEPVVWRTSSGDDGDTSLTIDNYLDFAQSVCIPECLSILRSSVRRAISTFAASRICYFEDYMEPVVSGIPRCVSINDIHHISSDDTIVLLCSVYVSGASLDLFIDSVPGKVVGCVFFFRHGETSLATFVPERPTGQRALPLSVLALGWISSNVEARSAAPVSRPWERLPGTPYVARGGSQAIALPRFDTRTGGSFYGESPNEAYALWQSLGALRIGHWENGQRHDLLGLNLRDLIRLDSVGLRRVVGWVSSTLRGLLHGIDGDRTCVIFPYHETVIELMELLRTELPFDRLKTFPVHRMLSPGSFNYMIAPLQREILARWISNVARRQPEKPIRIIILDDACVSGRTLQELRGVVDDIVATLISATTVPTLRIKENTPISIHTVAILDRTGRPNTIAGVRRFVQDNHRMWRWDVPRIGMIGACPLCSAIDRLHGISSRLGLSDLQFNRIQELISRWSPAKEGTNWSLYGVVPEALPRLDSSRFSRTRVRPKGGDVFHRVIHRISTSRTSIAVELAASTLDKRYPLDKARADTADGGTPLTVSTRIELLCVNVALFQMELSYVDIVERLQTILTLVFSEDRESDQTGLAIITFMSLDRAFMEGIFPTLWRHLDDKRHFPNVDALILSSYIHNSYIDAVGEINKRNHRAPDPLFRDATSACQQFSNLVRIGRSGRRVAFQGIYTFFGWDISSHHSGFFQSLFGADFVLDDSSASNVADMRYFLLSATIGLSKLVEAFEQLESFGATGFISRMRFDQVDTAEAISEIRGLLTSFRYADARNLQRRGENLSSVDIRMADGTPVSTNFAADGAPIALDDILGFRRRAFSLLFEESASGDPLCLRERFWRCNVFPYVLQDRLGAKPLLSGQWTRGLIILLESLLDDAKNLLGASNLLVTCVINDIEPARWGTNYPEIHLDPLVVKCLRDFFQNMKHVLDVPVEERELDNLTMIGVEDVVAGDYAVCFTLFTQLDGGEYLRITTVNRMPSGIDGAPLKGKTERWHLRSLGGAIDMKVENGYGIGQVDIPSIATLARE